MPEAKSLRLQPVRVGTGSEDQEGLLVFAGEVLVAVLVRLSDLHEENSGCWFLEVAFGVTDAQDPPLFENVDEAEHWIGQRIRREAIYR